MKKFSSLLTVSKAILNTCGAAGPFVDKFLDIFLEV